MFKYFILYIFQNIFSTICLQYIPSFVSNKENVAFIDFKDIGFFDLHMVALYYLLFLWPLALINLYILINFFKEKKVKEIAKEPYKETICFLRYIIYAFVIAVFIWFLIYWSHGFPSTFPDNYFRGLFILLNPTESLLIFGLIASNFLYFSVIAFIENVLSKKL